MARLPHQHRLDRPLHHASVRLIPGEDLEADIGDPARVAEDVVVGRVQDHVGDAVAVHILDAPDARAGGEAVDLYAQRLAVEVEQLKYAAVCAGAALQGQPGVARLDLHLSQAAFPHVVRRRDRRVAGREFLARQLLPVSVGLRIDRDEVVRQGREVEVAHPDAVNGPQRRLTGRDRQRQGNNPFKCTLREARTARAAPGCRWRAPGSRWQSGCRRRGRRSVGGRRQRREAASPARARSSP